MISIGKIMRSTAYLGLLTLLMVMLLPTAQAQHTPTFVKSGDAEGSRVGWLRAFDGVSGTRAENDANFHVCTNPAYSPANFTEIDGAFGGTTGEPTYQTPDLNNPPSYLYNRANAQHIKLVDNSASCTTGNDPWDFSLGAGNDLHMNAWVKPTETLTCGGTPIGDEYTIFSKWNSAGGNCSYQLVAQVYDTNGGGCNDVDLSLKLVGRFNDSSTTFSCGSPCEVEEGARPLITDAWNHVGFAIHSGPNAGRASTAYLMLNGKPLSSAATSEACLDATDIPDPIALNDTAEPLLIGNDVEGGSNGWEGQIATVKIYKGDTNTLEASRGMFQRMEFENGRLGNLVVDDGSLDQHALGLPERNPPTRNANGINGNSVEFNGSNYLATHTNALEATVASQNIKAMVAEAWIYPHAPTGSDKQHIISKWRYNNNVGCTDRNSSSFRLFLNNAGRVNFQVNSTTNNTFTETGTTVLAANTWYHVAGIITNDNSETLTANSVYVLVNGVNDGGTPTAFTDTRVKNGNVKTTFGATSVTDPGTTCASGLATEFYDGIVDEVRVGVYNNLNQQETGQSPLVINEVDIYDGEVELYMRPGTASMNFDDFSLTTCRAASEAYHTFDNACGSCASKIVDAGDFVTLVPGAGTDTSCSGGSTSCTWYMDNSASTINLTAGDFYSDLDGVMLYRQEPDDGSMILMEDPLDQKFALGLDGVIWGAEQKSCASLLSNQSRGIWSPETFREVGDIPDNTISLSRMLDGQDMGVTAWEPRTTSIPGSNEAAATAVTLISFTATQRDNRSVDLDWQTGTERNTFGFHVECADEQNDAFIRKNSTLILARGGVGAGAAYSYNIENADSCVYYRLVEVENSNIENVHGPITLNESQANKDETTAQPVDSLLADGASALGDSGDAGSSLPLAQGCGQIVATEDRAGPTLAFFMLLIFLLSSRTFLVSDWVGKVWK